MPVLDRREFLFGSLAAVHAAAASQKMNVLFVAADDMNTSLGCYGHPLVKSPNVDKLASRGVRFDRAYCQFPLCGPSRASLLTGLRPDTTKVLGNNIDFRDNIPDTVTLPQLFKQSGWYSARDGKMYHMNVPTEVGTNRFQDPPSWDLNFSPPGLEQKSPGQSNANTQAVAPGGEGVTMRWIATADGKGQADDNAADKAITILEEHAKQPFFLGLGFVRPHLPFVAPSKFFDLYPLDQIPAPTNPPNDLDDIPMAPQKIRPVQWNHQGMNERQQREARRGYYATTSYMDSQFGRVLDALERMKLASKTMIVFWGDHGWNLGEHTKWQKMCLFEETARVPLIISVPGTKGNGKVCRSLVEFVDLYPTIAELNGLKPPANLHGQSLVRLLDNPSLPFKKAAFTQIQLDGIFGRSVRTERYRYTRWEGAAGPGEELYDHESDPREFTNMAVDPKHAKTLEAMRGVLERGPEGARA